MGESAKPRLVGFNHVALDVGDIEEALAFYGRLSEPSPPVGQPTCATPVRQTRQASNQQ
jgi:hypothetical protein